MVVVVKTLNKGIRK